MKAIFAPLLLGTLALAAQSGPLATLKQMNGDVDKLLREKPTEGSPADKQKKSKITDLAASLLDYSELAKRSLGDHWNEFTPKQRDEFVKTFRELIEKHYVKQLKKNLEYQVQYKGEELAGEQATVTTIVKVKTKGKSTDAEIIYKMHNTDGKWTVWDVITDEVSLVRNYKSQFNKILADKGYDELIRKMKKKITDEEST